MQPSLPPGPKAPSLIQTMGWWHRPTAYLEKLRARYGKRFTLRLIGSPPFVPISDPDAIKELFQAPPEVLHPGEGARILQPVVGAYSVILLDEDPHLEQRKLLLPAFHGKKMEQLESLVTEVTEREVEHWPRNEPFQLHPKLQALTLEVILRAVFGLDPGPRLDRLRELLTGILEYGTHWESLVPPLHRNLGPLTKFRDMARLRAEADELIFELADERRAQGGLEEREDILSTLLTATHEDGSPMSNQELRDELVTLLTAGHETTASQLGFAFAILAHEPRVVERLQEEIDRGDGDDYLSATINEVLRRRPVLQSAEPRLTKEPVEIGGWLYPEGVSLMAHAYLLHHDADIYPDPYAFKPERFLDEPPGTYTLIPFGGGRRRCIGASFAVLEMKTVLRAVLERADVVAGADGFELSRRRNITMTPRRGAPAVLKPRVREPVPA